MRRRDFLTFAAAPLLEPFGFRHYVEEFNAGPAAPVESAIPDDRAFEWMQANVPRFTCPDPEFERTYYYRWWSFRKHIRQTPDGYIFTEFLRPVKHATDHNAISCALGHHIAEGRWLREPRYLDEYLRFWLRAGSGTLQRHYHQYSNWTAAAVYERWLADGRSAAPLELLDALVLDYTTWERERLREDGLFWQYDVRDGMEESVSGSRRDRNARPTINSYQYGNARAIARIATLAGRDALAGEFDGRARRLKQLVEQKLWDPRARFFKSLLATGALADVREAIGFTPWMFGLPAAGRGYEEAWRQLMDPRGFFAPFGPATAEQRHPGFQISESGDDCQWNGPSWPFATTVTLKALANVLHRGGQRVVSRADYFKTLAIYARSQRLKLADGRSVAWVDENLNPITGEWHARARKLKKGTFNVRGDHYNHSGCCDLVITGLAGLRPRADATVEVAPLLPQGTWDWFCLDDVPYHGTSISIVWDLTGKRFGSGAGLAIFANGREIGRARRLERLVAALPVIG
jgi:hypothetical protein